MESDSQSFCCPLPPPQWDGPALELPPRPAHPPPPRRPAPPLHPRHLAPAPFPHDLPLRTPYRPRRRPLVIPRVEASPGPLRSLRSIFLSRLEKVLISCALRVYNYIFLHFHCIFFANHCKAVSHSVCRFGRIFRSCIFLFALSLFDRRKVCFEDKEGCIPSP